MRNVLIISIFVWWFVASARWDNNNYGVLNKVGPFNSLEQCNDMRETIARTWTVYKCWEVIEPSR